MKTPRQRLKLNVMHLQAKRIEAVGYERLVQRDIAEVIREHGSAKVLARELGVSEAYLSDIRYGRRGIGDETVRKLMELK